MTNSDEKKIRELKSILRQIQSMEMHPGTGVIEMRSYQGLPTDVPARQSYNLPSVVYEQLYELHAARRRRISLSTYLFSSIIVLALSGSVILYILYKDAWFPKEVISSTIGIVKPGAQTKGVSGDSLQQRTEGLLESMKEKAQKQIQQANRLTERGKILAAREILLKLAKTEARFSKDMYAKVAVALARTYDANVLKTIASPDAFPDLIEAEYWYRQWYQTSSEAISTSSTKQ